MTSDSEAGLKRELGSFQQGMIAIGGIVGVGLFLGSGATIGLAGPAVVVTYLFGAVVAVSMGFVLAEMAIVHPVAGAFGLYADEYIGRWAGFLTRLSFWFGEMFALGAMVTAVGVYMAFWFEDTPQWVFTLVAAAVAIGVNALHVGRFGFLESWFSVVKVAAIALFVLLGTVLLTGRGVDNLTAHGGFFANGAEGVALALTLVVASFLGVEAIAITAAEAKHPERTVPRAVLGVVGTLVVLYVASMLVIVTATPWTRVAETSGTLTGSPFVQVFAEVGVPYAAGLMNFVVVSAAMTGAISHLYLGTRMLHSLAREGYAPGSLAVVDERGVPLRALAGSAVGLLLAVVLALYGQQAFLPLYGMGVAIVLSIWLVILFCHARFRRRLPPERLASLPVRVPLHPLPSIASAAIILVALAVTPRVAGLTWTIPMFVLWLVVAGLGYTIWSRRRTS